MSSTIDPSAAAADSALDAQSNAPAAASAAESAVPYAAEFAPNTDATPAASSSLAPLASPTTDLAAASGAGQMPHHRPVDLASLQQPPHPAGSLLAFLPPGSPAWNLAASLTAQGVDLSALARMPPMDLAPLSLPPLPGPTPQLDPSTLQLISAVTRTPGLKQQGKVKARNKQQPQQQRDREAQPVEGQTEEAEPAPKVKSRGRDRARFAAAAAAIEAAAAADSKPPAVSPPPTLSASGRPQRSAALRRKRVVLSDDDDSYDEEKDASAEEDDEEDSEAEPEEEEEEDEEEIASDAEADEAYTHEYTRKRSHRSAPQRNKVSASKRSSSVHRRAPFTRVLADQANPAAAADPQVKQEPETEADADSMQASHSHHQALRDRDLADAEMDPGSEYTGEADASSRDHTLSHATSSSAASSRMGTPAQGRPFAVADSDGKFVCNVCEVRFGRNSNLTRHMRIHEAVKRFKCPRPGCDKEFMEKHHLEAHDRTHTGDRPFTCPLPDCHRTFTDRSNCSRHIRTHYPGGVAPPRMAPLTTAAHTPTRGPHKKPRPATAGQDRGARRHPADQRGGGGGGGHGSSMRDAAEQTEHDEQGDGSDGMGGRPADLSPQQHFPDAAAAGSPSVAAGGFLSQTSVRQSSRARVAKAIALDHVESWTDTDRSDHEHAQAQQVDDEERKHEPHQRDQHQQQQHQQEQHPPSGFVFDASSAVHASYHVLASPEPAAEYGEIEGHHLVPASASSHLRREQSTAPHSQHRSGGKSGGGSSSKDHHSRRSSHKRPKLDSAASGSSLVNLLDAAEAMSGSSASSGASAPQVDPPPLQLQSQESSSPPTVRSEHYSPPFPPMQRSLSCASDSLTQVERIASGAPSTPQRHALIQAHHSAHGVSPISAASLPHTPSGFYPGSCSMHSPILSSKQQTTLMASGGGGGIGLPLSPHSPHRSANRVSSPSMLYAMPSAHPHSQAQMMRQAQHPGHTLMHAQHHSHQQYQHPQQYPSHYQHQQHPQVPLMHLPQLHQLVEQPQQPPQQPSWREWMMQQMQRQHFHAATTPAANTQPAASVTVVTHADRMP